MNQILSVEMPKSKPGSYRNRNSNKADIKTVIVFFCIILILFALIIAVVGVSLMNKKEENVIDNTTVITGTQPTINVELTSETTLNIIVSHDKQISSISYSWNDEEAVVINDIGENNKEIQIEKPAGTNTLNINVTDINGVTQTYSEQHDAPVTVDGPSLVLEYENGKIKVTAQSNVQIAYISYNWDGGEEKQIEVNDVKTEQYIEVPEGEHTLNVVLVDVEGGETTDTKKMIGDYKPTLNISTDKKSLFIEATDDEGLTKLTVQVYNTDEIQEFEINDKQFNKTLPLKYQDNKLIITLYNINGLKNEKRVRIVK